jgi:hypothetical protein
MLPLHKPAAKGVVPWWLRMLLLGQRGRAIRALPRPDERIYLAPF